MPIVRNPGVLGGKPIVEGTRLSVEALDVLERARSREDVKVKGFIADDFDEPLDEAFLLTPGADTPRGKK